MGQFPLQYTLNLLELGVLMGKTELAAYKGHTRAGECSSFPYQLYFLGELDPRFQHQVI